MFVHELPIHVLACFGLIKWVISPLSTPKRTFTSSRLPLISCHPSEATAVNAEGMGFGFGAMVVRPGPGNAGEYGWDGDAGTSAWMNPVQRVAGVIMVQYFQNSSTPIVNEARRAIGQDMAAMVG
jgi:CubicO group peptidase (beta-lactamase class C family)